MIEVLVYALTERLGGIENFFINYNKEFNEIKMDFISISPDVSYWDKLNKNDNTLYFLPRRKDGIKKRNIALEAILNKKQYDIFWYNGNDVGDIDILKIAKKSGIKTIICHAHNSSADKYYRKILHLIHRKKIDELVTHKFACSALAARWFFENKENVQLIYNAINIENYKYSEILRKEIRQQLNISEDTMVIGNVGRLCLQKNQKYLLKIFKKYIQKNSNAKLVILGEGDMRNELEQQIQEYQLEDKVLIPGQVSNVAAYLMAFDTLLMPSLYEGLPVTLVEAQAAGLDCVVSEIITHEVEITDDITYLPITEESCADWVKNIKKSKNREEASRLLEESLFNIKTSALKLEKYLLKEVKNTHADSFA